MNLNIVSTNLMNLFLITNLVFMNQIWSILLCIYFSRLPKNSMIILQIYKKLNYCVCDDRGFKIGSMIKKFNSVSPIFHFFISLRACILAFVLLSFCYNQKHLIVEKIILNSRETFL